MIEELSFFSEELEYSMNLSMQVEFLSSFPDLDAAWKSFKKAGRQIYDVADVPTNTFAKVTIEAFENAFFTFK